MTLNNDEELAQALDAVALLYQALAALHRDVAPKSMTRFRLMAEGIVDEIEAIEARIHAYTGRNLVRAYTEAELVAELDKGIAQLDAGEGIVIDETWAEAVKARKRARKGTK